MNHLSLQPISAWEDVDRPITRAQALEWIEALRSGKYVQGRDVMRAVNPSTKETRYCCLGVLDKVCAFGSASNGIIMRHSVCAFGSASNGIIMRHSAAPIAMPTALQNRFTNLNDGYQFTFAQIADVIEQELLPTLQ